MTTYKDAGVDVHLKETLLRRIRDHVASTHRPEVIGGIGAFGGMFRFGGMRDGVLVASADGVGTKVKIAELLDSHETVGADLVDHCINDIAVMGAEPLFFLDYFSAGKLDPGRFERVVRGVADACREAGIALLGGETAEAPGLYSGTDYDLAGFIVGAVERDRILAPAQHQNGTADAIRMEIDVTGQEVADQMNGLGNHAPGKIHLLGFGQGAEPKAMKILLLKAKRTAERHQERILQTQEAKGPRRSKLEPPGRRAGQKHQRGYCLRLGRLLRHQSAQTMGDDNRRKRRAADDSSDIFHASGKVQLLENRTRPLFEPPAKIHRPTLPPEIAEMSRPLLPAPAAAP